jgi:hypothetical protein
MKQVKNLLRENRVEDIVDNNLETFDPKEVETILQVALLCTQAYPEDRPTMSEVVKMLLGVGLADRWADWKQLEETRNEEIELSLMTHQFPWSDESTLDQEAIQLSRAR